MHEVKDLPKTVWGKKILLIPSKLSGPHDKHKVVTVHGDDRGVSFPGYGSYIVLPEKGPDIIRVIGKKKKTSKDVS